MKILLDTSELKSLYSLLKPLCDYVPFSSAIITIVSISLTNFSRSQTSEIWELIENCEDDELHYFLNMSDNVFIQTFELNINMFMEYVYKYIERVSGVRMDSCEVIDSNIRGSTLIIDVRLG